MRQGNNPLRGKSVEQLKPVCLLVVTHLPNLTDYHASRLEVIQTCIQSMKHNAGMETSLLIWDNGSCEELRQWIRDEVKPDVFVESVNVGKGTGRAALLRMLPPKTIAAYSDDDIYYYPDWLRPQIELLQEFPNVSTVTGYAVRTAFRWACEKTKAWARDNATLETGRFIPDAWERDFAVSIGRNPSEHYYGTRNDFDYLITYNGKKAYATSHHCQFVGYAGTLAKATVFDNAAMGDEKPLDFALESLGLRLATVQRLTRHIGNVIDDELRKEIVIGENKKWQLESQH